MVTIRRLLTVPVAVVHPNNGITISILLYVSYYPARKYQVANPNNLTTSNPRAYLHNILIHITSIMFNHLMTSALVLVTLTDAHMTLNTPKPYGAPSTSPLSTANYPCQLQGDPGTFYARTTATKMAVGEDQKLTFAGDASHNGGSCQISITSDLQPTTATHWQVIKSIIGGCPTTGNSGGSSEYSFKIPEGVCSRPVLFRMDMDST